MPAFIDLTGRRIERLLVVSMAEKKPGKNITWNCVCDCGVVKVIQTGSLKSGRVKSCGCLSRENTIKRNTTHGNAGEKVSRAYNSWSGMIDRCRNPNNKKYKDYGGRGIKVSEEWMDFNTFLNDMGHSPSAGYSIDRVDVNGNYEKSNCRWATPLEQASNRRNNVIVKTPHGDMCASAAARFYGINRSVLVKRVKKGWNHHEALNTPVGKRGAHIRERVGSKNGK
ncbi:hypothetical protein [Pantoea ananatis]|uniref:hypothetical protein n=1 Tax=Pantoea ananas TaxID=553 RepID=UPI001B301E7B|nr:hypothetical protein [Pantoea ananatis]